MTFKNLLAIFLIAHLSSATAGTITFSEPKVSFSVPSDFIAKKNKNNRACYKLFHKQNGKKTFAADVCLYPNSNNESKIRETGFASYSTFPEDSIGFANPPSGFVYSSPMSIYPAELINTMNTNGYIAKNVDCDVENEQPMYKATGTCDVAFMLLENNIGIYVNFIIKNNVRNFPIGTHNNFMFILNSIKHQIIPSPARH
jgi:hypothetical protein